MVAKLHYLLFLWWVGFGKMKEKVVCDATGYEFSEDEPINEKWGTYWV